jgi:phosphohistidine phosphatase
MTEGTKPTRKPAARKPAAKPAKPAAAAAEATKPTTRSAVAAKAKSGSATKTKPAAPTAKPAAAAVAGKRPVAPPNPRSLTLLFIRHADAGDAATWPGDDAARPLSKKGRRQAKRLGDLLDRLRVRPDAILTSPRVRAADTAKIVGRRVGRDSTVDDRLDAGFDAKGLAALVAEVAPAASTVAIVGHDPDFSTLASWLVDAPLSMSKGALARIELPERTVGPGKGTLRWLLPPDAIPG